MGPAGQREGWRQNRGGSGVWCLVKCEAWAVSPSVLNSLLSLPCTLHSWLYLPVSVPHRSPRWVRLPFCPWMKGHRLYPDVPSWCLFFCESTFLVKRPKSYLLEAWKVVHIGVTWQHSTRVKGTCTSPEGPSTVTLTLANSSGPSFCWI